MGESENQNKRNEEKETDYLLKTLNGYLKNELLCLMMNKSQRVNPILYISDALRATYILKKELYRGGNCTGRLSTKAMMEEWIYLSQKCDMKDYYDCANILLIWQRDILKSFDAPYTNSFTEGCNNKI